MPSFSAVPDSRSVLAFAIRAAIRRAEIKSRNRRMKVHRAKIKRISPEANRRRRHRRRREEADIDKRQVSAFFHHSRAQLSPAVIIASAQKCAPGIIWRCYSCLESTMRACIVFFHSCLLFALIRSAFFLPGSVRDAYLQLYCADGETHAGAAFLLSEISFFRYCLSNIQTIGTEGALAAVALHCFV